MAIHNNLISQHLELLCFTRNSKFFRVPTNEEQREDIRNLIREAEQIRGVAGSLSKIYFIYYLHTNGEQIRGVAGSLSKG